MYTETYLARIEEHDPILAEKFRTEKVTSHQPAWDSNGLTLTRDLSSKEAEKLEDWFHSQ